MEDAAQRLTALLKTGKALSGMGLAGSAGMALNRHPSPRPLLLSA
jgi:hypothetical protein